MDENLCSRCAERPVSPETLYGDYCEECWDMTVDDWHQEEVDWDAFTDQCKGKSPWSGVVRYSDFQAFRSSRVVE